MISLEKLNKDSFCFDEKEDCLVFLNKSKNKIAKLFINEIKMKLKHLALMN